MLPGKIAHLDLKGMQRQPEPLLRHLETLQAMGYDGLLMEYEDVFPYAHETFSLAPEEAWSREFLRTFLNKAGECGLQVIPLQQTLAHLEYGFRWERCREHGITHPVTQGPIESTTLHIGRKASREWMKSLLREMIAAHPDSEFIHLGMDESWALGVYARDSQQDPLALFLGWLEELCEVCAGAGKTPLLWSDMLEDHLNPENLERLCALREKVVLVCWDYASAKAPLAMVRFAGWRTSRHWAQCPREAGGAPMRANQQWMEDWPPEIAALVSKYRVGERHMESLFQAAVWKELGFRVLGACGVAIMMEGPLLSRYHRRMDNLDRWRECVQKWRLDGLIVTAWARGGTTHPPTVVPDLHLPMLEYAVRGSGLPEEVVFKGIPHGELERVLALLGRGSEEGAIAAALLRELKEMTPRVQSHHDEWKTLLLMAETFVQRAKCASLTAEAGQSRYANRLTWVEWGCRLDACSNAKAGFQTLRGEVAAHLAERYHGIGLREWLANSFDVPLADLDAAEAGIAGFLSESTKRYS